MLKTRTRLLIGLGVLSVVFFFLRVKTLGHLLMWDEAWNILSLRTFLQGAVKSPFYWYSRFHPPLYMSLASLLFPFKAGFAMRAECLSLLFSYATFVIVYFLSNRIGGWKFAMLTGLFLVLMPVSIGYDTWIKRDCLAIALGYLGLWLLIDRKVFWSAVALGLSLLSKESALFFILAATLLVFITGQKQKPKIFLTYFAVILAVTAWWYIPLSTLTKNITGFYFSKDIYGESWINPAYYYVKKLLPDMGISTLILSVIGVFYLSYLAFYKKLAEWSMPVVTALCVYVPISLVFTTKTPWLSISAAPALAMLAGGGALFILKISKRFKWFFLVLYLLVAFSIFSGFAFSYPAYHLKTYPNGWPGAKVSKYLAGYLNKHMKKGDKLLITEFAYWRMPTCPVFLYYWEPRDIEIIEEKPTADEVINKIKKNRISWLVIANAPDPDHNLNYLVKGIRQKLKEKGTQAGWSFVWNTKKLWAD